MRSRNQGIVRKLVHHIHRLIANGEVDTECRNTVCRYNRIGQLRRWFGQCPALPPCHNAEKRDTFSPPPLVPAPDIAWTD